MDKVRNVSMASLFFLAVALFVGGLFYLETTDIQEDVEEKLIKRSLKVAGVFFVISIAATIFIPSKEEMYMMALTKGYEAEDVYKMTKDEIKGSIDYVFDRVKELKDE